MLKIYRLKFNEEFHSDFSEAMSNKYKDIASNKMSNFAWYSLEKILLKEYDYIITKEKIIFNEFNKPYILNDVLYFNISHSNDYVLIAISDSEVGVDIQSEIPLEKADLIIKRFDQKTNIEYINSIDKVDYFSKKWVGLEAYGKMNGNGLSFKGTFEFEDGFNYDYFIDGIRFYTCVINKNKEKGRVENYVLY